MASFPSEADRLLQRIRTLVGELRRLEQERADRRELLRRRREIARLQWRLARLVSHDPGGGNLAA
jgi:hypothetical protein